MDNDRDMRVSIEELKTVLSNSNQGRKKMNSTLFRNLVEKSEKVNIQELISDKLTNRCNVPYHPKCSSGFDRILLDRTELTDAYLTECVVDRIRVDRMRT